MGVNVFRYHLICEYLTWQLIPATIYHRHTRAVTRRAERSPSRGRILWAQPLPFTPKTQGTRRGGGIGWAAAPLAGAWRAEMGRTARVQRGRPGSVPHLSAVSVSTRPLRVAGDLRRVPIRGVKNVSLLSRQEGPTEIWTRIAGFRVQSAHHYTMEPPREPPGLHRQTTVSASLASIRPTHKLRAVLLRPWGDSNTVDSPRCSTLSLSLCSSPLIDSAHSHLRKWGEIHFGFCAREDPLGL